MTKASARRTPPLEESSPGDGGDGEGGGGRGRWRRVGGSGIGSLAGAVYAGARAESVRSARVVSGVLRDVRPNRAVDLAADAARVFGDRGPTGKDGAFGQVTGKLFERMDADTVKRLILSNDPQAKVDGHLVTKAGAKIAEVSHKKSAAGVGRAASSTDPRVTFRVPADQAEAAAATGRKVMGSKVTTKGVDRTAERGLKHLSKAGPDGARAVSHLRAAGRASVAGAAGAVVLGGATDYLTGVRRGEMTWSEFGVQRVADVGQGAVSGVVTWGAGYGAASAVAATALAGTAAAPVVVPLVITAAAGIGFSVATKPLRRWATNELHERVFTTSTEGPNFVLVETDEFD
jgi:hypothetical protein